MEKFKRLLVVLPAWVLTGVCLVAILWLTLAPRPLGEMDVPLFPGADKLVHGIMFGGLALCMVVDYERRGGHWKYVTVWGALLCGAVASLVGLGIEYAQLFMQLGRGFEWWDWCADSTGAFLFPLLWMWVTRRTEGER